MSTSAPALDDVRTVVELASLAPSVHNSQPWRFRWDGAVLEVREDAGRALPVLDPSGRERVLSCGAAVLHAELAFAELGWAVTTTLLPDPDDALLARVRPFERRPASARQHALVGAVLRRTTDRDPYDSRQVALPVLEQLRVAAEAEGAWLRRVDPHHGELDLDVLLARADAAQRRDPAYLAELAQWRTEQDTTGVPTRGLSQVPAGQRASTLALRDFDAGPTRATEDQPQAQDPLPPPAEHPAVVVLGTAGDSRRDWLQVGRATAHVLLAATVEGVAAQPLTAVLEVPSTRAGLRSALGAVGQPQMVLRLGYGTRGPVSRRLPVDDVLEVATTPA